jgi:carbonic anhydrase
MDGTRMQKLVDGLHSFQSGFFATNRQLFEQLATAGQQPETLFITCSDSRLVPNLITNSQPGELFIIRNVGNVVPPRDLPGGTAAALEYAVEVLEVQNIIICGHTQCGAVRAIMNPDSVSHLPYVTRWLSGTRRVRDFIEEKYAHLTPDERWTAATQENVLVQLENLREYPFVAKRLDEGKLHVSGWVFQIGTGDVFDFNPALNQFVPLRPSQPPETP